MLAYVDERATSAGQDGDTLSALIPALSSRIEELEARNQELESTVRSLQTLSEQLQAALREAQLGFRRHVRQRVAASELQAALALSFDAAAPGSKPAGSEASEGSPTSEAQESAASAAAETTESASQQEPPAGGPAAKKRDRHGRRNIGIIPQVFIDIVPPQVQLEGLKHFEQIGAEQSAVVGYRRGGPVQVVFRRIKFVPIGSTESNDMPADDAATAAAAQSSEMSDYAQDAPADAAGGEFEPSAAVAGADSAADSAAGCELEPSAAVAGADSAAGCELEPSAAVAGADSAAGCELDPTTSVRQQSRNSLTITLSASEILCLPPDTAFKCSPFVDGALVWYEPDPPEPEPNEQVLIGVLPQRPLDKGMADASLIARVICRKLDYHMPYYRQQTELSRFGLPISRANLCRWHFECGAIAESIAGAMWNEALARSWFAMDATGTAIFDRPRYRKGHVFVLVAPGDGVLFRYAPVYDGATVNELFGGTDATIVADASSCHNLVFGPGKHKGSGCWSHGRKRFVAAFNGGEKQLAAIGLQFIRVLFRIEDEIALLSPQDRLRIRTEKSAPIVAAFYQYVEQHSHLVSAQSLMHAAFVYVTNQRDMLCRFLTNGELPIHNNASERALRRVVKGRLNWLFMRSDEHAEHTCALYSLVASCDQHGLDPEFYLQEVLTVAPSWPASRVIELSPKYWVQTRQELIRQGRLRYIDLGAVTGSRLQFRPC